MNYISTNYDTLDDTPMPYDEAFIRQWAGKLKVDAKLLEQTLADAFDEYLSLKIRSNRFDRWHQARDQFETINNLLLRTIKRWKKVSPHNREAFELLITDRLRFDELHDQLHLIQCDVQEVIEWGTRERGNQGQTRRAGSQDVNLEPLEAFTIVIQRFWQDNVDRPFGLRIEKDYSRGREDNPEDSVPEPKSLGIRFLHECLNKLEPNFDAASCQSMMRKLRAQQSRTDSA